MSSNLPLNWAIVALSLFNALLLTWLGLTVLLNSDRRAWGIWIASGGLLLGALFFVSHSAIAGLGLANLSWRSMIFWWALGLFPVITLPFTWYVVILWYAGFWHKPPARLRHRQKIWLIVVIGFLVLGLVCLVLGVILMAIPAPSLNVLRSFIRWSVAGIPLLAAGYSLYALLCTGLALDALRQPGVSTRVMGNEARQRARPWLMGASLLLLAVSFLVTGVMLWIVQDSRRRTFLDIYLESRELFAWVDLLASLLICGVILLVGQAIVSYEVFTGNTLPRRGLARHWQRAVILSAGIAVLVSTTLTIQLRPLYSLVLVAMLIAVAYAMISWRSYVERERYMAQLRPFVSSQHLLDQLITQTPQKVDITSPFQALCVDVLDAKLAFLTAVGPLAPLVGEPLSYPPANNPCPPVADLVSYFDTPEIAMRAVNPARYYGAILAVPLWSERGLIGLFLIGEKRSRSLYSQEEIEIVRVTGERLIDTQASGEMARKLMRLQRERLAQSQLIDQQTRRVLHDEILPTLQAALISLDGTLPADNGELPPAIDMLTSAHRQISDLLHDMPTTTVPEVATLGLLSALQRAVDNELAASFDEVTWAITPEATTNARRIPTLTAEVVFYAAREVVRNAAKYGRDPAGAQPLYLRVEVTWIDGLRLVVTDNGVGFQPNELSEEAAGHGLALHSTMMAVVGGELTIESVPGELTRVAMHLPSPVAAPVSA